MGVVTKLATSFADAPAKGIKTLAMVTSICGSSSRGVTSAAKTPNIKPNSANKAVNCERDAPSAIAPEKLD
ncbi:hypothetical protein GNIT_3373 [Glaciecola nitratireducens FR1064]|uniref:Uncharacterized protein n=1 Tax=Glaciecola nitratireducens (strain JCM 12485 / KCTC 12276 / FR1064) TaxID=1085623 RepID=G4QN49_GLANF|nr:hypothetical protein GNIT_3373 [Glaciecola nitratireducens FR1064]